ncbi:carbon-nitrogen hydrolase [Fusarium oxysporum f. sp. phaseoli]
MTSKTSPPSRVLTVAAAQLGPIKSLSTPRSEALDRMIKLLEQAADKNVKLLVYPELAFTTFFASYIIKDPKEVAKFFEQTSPSHPYAFVKSPNIKPLIDRTNELGIDLYFGFGERWVENDRSTDYNTSVYYSASERRCIAKYRKIHLPGRYEPLTTPGVAHQLEKRYFTVGDLGFQAFRAPGLVDDALKAQDVTSADDARENQGRGDPIIGMLLCNDRRWAEGWRCYGLQGVELLLEGYNTTAYAPQYDGSPEWQEQEALFHHRLSCQSGSYSNACFSIHSAKAGIEDHGSLISGSCIVDPNGHIISEAKTKDDELVYATIDLCECRKGKGRVFAFDDHRRPEHYSRLLEQTGVQEPPFLD